MIIKLNYLVLRLLTARVGYTWVFSGLLGWEWHFWWFFAHSVIMRTQIAKNNLLVKN